MMTEISLNILDIAENSIRAQASLITISVRVDTQADKLDVTIEDNGCGMTPEQVRAALEAKAAGTLATTAMLYSHRDIYELLVFRSYGTPYEHFLDWLVDEEDRTTLRVLELIHGAEKARAVISKESLHIVNHAFYSALSENIIHAKSVEELNATTEVISTFFNAGWEKYRTL